MQFVLWTGWVWACLPTNAGKYTPAEAEAHEAVGLSTKPPISRAAYVEPANTYDAASNMMPRTSSIDRQGATTTRLRQVASREPVPYPRGGAAARCGRWDAADPAAAWGHPLWLSTRTLKVESKDK